VIINWGALALVACATVVAAISIVGLLALGAAALTAGADRAAAVADGRGATVIKRVGSRLNLLTVAGFACLGTAGLFALYGLYLIIPQFG
jgi:hypothetical protein